MQKIKSNAKNTLEISDIFYDNLYQNDSKANNLIDYLLQFFHLLKCDFH